MRGAYQKFRLRNSIDYPLAGVAVALKILPGGICERGAVAITALNPKPQVIPGSAEALAGAALTDELLEKIAALAARAMKPLTTSASTPDYRRHIATVFVKRALAQAWT
jgi:4-hydroxybenzoyl-CoA reductase subunit beta